MGSRLNKYISNSGLCSRRAADELIAEGRVKINGIVAIQGAKVEEDDIILIDDKEIEKKEENIYLLLHKPLYVLSTVSDPEGRDTVLDILPEKYKNFRLYPVGRLDFFSEGLIFLTNDGEVAHKLMHPRHNLSRIYRVRVRKETNLPIEKLLNDMQNGMILQDGTELAPVYSKIFNKNENKGEFDIEFTLYQGVNRQIRRMCEEKNLVILRLMRIAHGPLYLDGLKNGQVRELSQEEVKELYRI